MENLLITGGAGFIGSHFVDACLNGTYSEFEHSRLEIVDSLTYAGSLKNLHPHLGNNRLNFNLISILDTTRINSIVKNTDCIVHFAAETHVDRSITNPDVFLETNVVGTHNLIKLATEYGKKIIIISTDEVYGSLEFGSAKEDYPLKPSSPYSASKAAADLLALSYHRTYGTKIIITRCTNNYGPKQFPEKLIPLTIKNMLANKKIGIYGDGNNIRDWIHVKDHVDGIIRCIFNGKIGEVYNFGGQNEISNIDLIKKIIYIMGKNEDSIEFIKDRLGHDFRYSLNIEKVGRELGWQPKLCLENELDNIVNWYVHYFNSI